jgi:long-chain fatty acid transport protein
MHKSILAVLLTICSFTVSTSWARPYPGLSGLAATADSARTAATNPAGIARFSERAFDGELIWVSSESEWESEFTGIGNESSSKDSSDTFVPRFAYIHPINDRFNASFTFIGSSFSDDLGEWPGRFFMQEYDSVMVSAYPSVSYKINDEWSIAASLALSYSSFEQERVVLNFLDPGFGEGRSKIDTDSLEFGFGVSALYQQSERTRWGLVYSSEIEAEQDGDNSLSNLGPNTEAFLDGLGLIGADVTVESTSPQSLLLGVYHEFENNHAFTVDLAWSDFSNFRLSEFYFNNQGLMESSEEYNDIYALSASYSFPVTDRLMMGVNGLVTNEMIDDEDRNMTLRLDTIWSLGVAAEWQWTDTRAVNFSVSYLRPDNAPVETPDLPGLGSLVGEYKSRDTWIMQVGMSFGGL